MSIAPLQETPATRMRVAAAGGHVASEQVWQQLDRASFAVIGYVTPGGEPRSSGVVYRTVGKRLYTAVAPDSWKARHIAAHKHVSVTVPVRRGGIFALVLPIPPATITFQAKAIVHAPGSIDIGSLPEQLQSLLPSERRHAAVVIELIPEGHFLTYGVGVPLMDMRKAELGRALIPVGA